jgi:hypothetical protein
MIIVQRRYEQRRDAEVGSFSEFLKSSQFLMMKNSIISFILLALRHGVASVRFTEGGKAFA